PTSLLPASKFPVGCDVGQVHFGTAKEESSLVTRGPVQKMLKVADGTEVELEACIGEVRLPLIGRDFIDKYKVRWNDKCLFGVKDGEPFTLREFDPRVEGCDDSDGNLFMITSEDLDDDAKPSGGMRCQEPRLMDLVKKWVSLTEGLGRTDLVKHRIETAPG